MRRLFGALIGLVVLVGVLAQPASGATQIVGLWHLGETSGKTAVDSSGRGNNGTFGSGVKINEPGAIGKSYFFSTGHITVPSRDSLNPGSKNFNISAYVKVNKDASPPTFAKDYDIVRKGLSTSAGGDFKFELIPQVYCVAKGAGKSEVSVTSDKSAADGNWHKISCGRSGNTLTVTIDGVSKSKSFSSIGSISNSAPLTIGAKSDGDDQHKGWIDDVVYQIG